MDKQLDDVEKQIVLTVLLTDAEATKRLRLRPQTLRTWRATGRHLELPYIKLGSRVFYAERDIEAFISGCRVDKRKP